MQRRYNAKLCSEPDLYVATRYHAFRSSCDVALASPIQALFIPASHGDISVDLQGLAKCAKKSMHASVDLPPDGHIVQHFWCCNLSKCCRFVHFFQWNESEHVVLRPIVIIWHSKKVQDKGLGAPCHEKPLEKSGLEPVAPNRLADRKHCALSTHPNPHLQM